MAAHAHLRIGVSVKEELWPVNPIFEYQTYFDANHWRCDRHFEDVKLCLC